MRKPSSQLCILFCGAFLLASTGQTSGNSASRLAASGPASVAPVSATATAPDLFQRVVLLGASVTAGFSAAEPFGGSKTSEYQFGNFIEAGLIGSHETIVTHANRFLFLKPKETMQKQVAATVSSKPTLVIALDALFWFCYGDSMTAEQRLERFSSGLELLEQINAPLVLGDIPDASAAVGKMLSRAQMPERSTINKCNERLKAWAASRRNVTLFALSEVLRKAGANEEIAFAGITWKNGETRAFLQPDRLHPSRHGLAAMAIGVLDSAATAAGLPGTAASVLREPDKVYEAGIVLGKARGPKASSAPSTVRGE